MLRQQLRRAESRKCGELAGQVIRRAGRHDDSEFPAATRPPIAQNPGRVCSVASTGRAKAPTAKATARIAVSRKRAAMRFRSRPGPTGETSLVRPASGP